MFVLLCSSFVQAADTTDIVSISGLRKSYCQAIAIKNAGAAIKSLARLQLFVYTDWKYFDEDQLDSWVELSESYVNSIKQTLNVNNVWDCLQAQKKEDASWLLQKIEQNQARIDWSVLLGALSSKPSNEELKAHRIAMLQECACKYMLMK